MDSLHRSGAIASYRGRDGHEGDAREAPHWFQLCSYYVNEARGTIEELRRHKRWTGCYVLAQQAVSALTGALNESQIEAHAEEWVDEYLQEGRQSSSHANYDRVSARVWMEKKLDEVRLQYFQATVELLKEDPFGEILSQCYAAVYAIASETERASAARSLVKALVPRSGRRRSQRPRGRAVGGRRHTEGTWSTLSHSDTGVYALTKY